MVESFCVCKYSVVIEDTSKCGANINQPINGFAFIKFTNAL